MASVHTSRSRTYAAGETDQDQAPEHVQSQGEILIKQMVQKQMETRVTLDDQLTRQKEFERAIEFEPLTKYISGQNTLKEFQETTSKVTRKEYLQSLGLTSEEIELVFDQDRGDEFLSSKHKNIGKSSLFNRIEEIDTKIKEAEAKRAPQVDVITLPCSGVSRHERELGLAVKPESSHTRLYQFSLSCQPSTSDSRPASHPIHHLKDIEQELFGHIRKKRRRKRKPNLKTKELISTSPQVTSTKDVVARSSLWDIKVHNPEPKGNPVQVVEKKVYSCTPQVLYTIQNKKIVRLKDVQSTATTPDEEISYSGQPFVSANIEAGDIDPTCQRLTEAQIKEIPKFLNYDRGVPSKVLYVKNLHRNVKEDDLLKLFKPYESPGEPRLVYRLMAGKMKGQAFITFNDIARATKAIDERNGCIVNGQPIIIQFGKST